MTGQGTRYYRKLSRFVFMLVVLFPLLGLTAEFTLVPPTPSDTLAIGLWDNIVNMRLVSGDTVFIDGRRYDLGKELDSGEGGRVFLLEGRPSPQIIKIQRYTNHSLRNRHLISEIESLEELARRGIHAPRILEFPTHKLFVVKEYIEGEIVDHYFQHLDEHPIIEIAQRLKSIAELLRNLDRWKTNFDDFHSANMLFGGPYKDTTFVFDPGATERATEPAGEFIIEYFFGEQKIGTIALRLLYHLMDQQHTDHVTANMEVTLIRIFGTHPDRGYLENFLLYLWGANTNSPHSLEDQRIRHHLRQTTNVLQLAKLPGFWAAIENLIGKLAISEADAYRLMEEPNVTILHLALIEKILASELFQTGDYLRTFAAMFEKGYSKIETAEDFIFLYAKLVEARRLRGVPTFQPTQEHLQHFHSLHPTAKQLDEFNEVLSKPERLSCPEALSS